MSQQALDLRRSVQIVRRHRKLFGAMVALGLLIGAAYAILKPPVLTSTALVVLPQASAQTAQSGVACGRWSRYRDPSSDREQHPRAHGRAASCQPGDVDVRPCRTGSRSRAWPGASSRSARAARLPRRRRTMANAVADSYIAYVTPANSPVGQVRPASSSRLPLRAGAQANTRIGIFGAARRARRRARGIHRLARDQHAVNGGS